MFDVFKQDTKTASRTFVGKEQFEHDAVCLADCALIDGASAVLIFDQEGRLVYFSRLMVSTHVYAGFPLEYYQIKQPSP